MATERSKEPAKPDAGESLKRLGGGRWQTRDERFTIEPQSGTWSVVDAEETDDFGLPLVRGPFKTLTDAKEAIASARAGAAPASPLTARLADRRDRTSAKPKPSAGAGGAVAPEPARRPSGTSDRPKPGQAERPAEDGPREPGWFRDLDPAGRGRARRLIDRLTAAGAADAEGIVRRDLAGDVPALAAHAIASRLEALGEDADPNEIAQLLAEGRDDDLGVRWRLVDGAGRPITLEATPAARRHRTRS